MPGKNQRHDKDIRPSEITSEGIYQRRRDVLKLLGSGAVTLAAGCQAEPPPPAAAGSLAPPHPADGTDTTGGEAQTTYKDATHYNNYYEFGTDKSDPAANSSRFHPQPWRVEIAGHHETN